MNLRKINTCQKYSSTSLSSIHPLSCLCRFDNKDLMNKMRTTHGDLFFFVLALLWSQMSLSCLCFLTFIHTEIENSDNDTASKNRRLVFFILITQSLARFWRRCLAAAANPNAPQPSPARPAAALDLLASAGRIKSWFLGHVVRPGELSKLSVIQHNRWRGSTSDVCESHHATPPPYLPTHLAPLAKELDLDLRASHVCQPSLQ